ncbi:MAG: hypothetical protein Q9180_007202, partial [Flavoplaca navasiana]
LGNLRHSEAGDINVHPASGYPLARFAITHVKSTGTAVLRMLAHHSVFDAVSIGAFFRDLEANIRGSHTTDIHTSYKLFADTYYLHSQSLTAQNSIAYHVSRLRGIAHLPGPNNAPSAPSSATIQATPSLPTYATLSSSKNAPKSRTTAVTQHGISAPVFFIAALALLTSRLSHSSEIIFAQSQAGRSWPFLEPHLAAYLPNPITIAGNTLGLVFDRIHTFLYHQGVP